MLKEDTPGYTGTAYLLVQLMGSSYLNILEFHNNAWCLYHMTMLLTCGPFFCSDQQRVKMYIENLSNLDCT